MAIFHDSAIVGASGNQGGGGGYQIERSLRFNSSDSAYLSRTPASAGNRKTWTWAGWVKRSGLGQDSRIFSAATSGSNQAGITFNTDNTIEIFDYQGTYGYRKITTQVFRDASAWYHFCLVADFDSVTAEDRLRFFVNGSRVTVFSTNTNPSSGYATGLINSAIQHGLGAYTGPAAFFSGYLADIHFIDGQALDPTSFTETDATTGQLIPKAYSGTYGTNGFHLPFSDNSTAAALGTDTSGNSNTWTVNNISVAAGAGNDSLVDTPTSYGTDTGAGGEVRGNYCTWNPLNKHANVTLLNGNLHFSNTASSNYGVLSTIGVTSGKYYIEHLQATGASDALVTGFMRTSFNAVTNVDFPGDSSFFGYTYAGRKWSFGSQTNGNTTLTVGSDILCFAIDLDAGKAWAGKNGVWFSSGDPATGANPYWTFTANTAYTFATVIYNATGSTNWGARPFAYTAPSGYKALCTANLPAPVVAQPSTVMDVKLYTGNGSTQTISGLGFSPDLVWYKSRSNGTWNHGLFDIVRGTSKQLFSNTTGAEGTYSGVTSFNSDGFTLGSDNGGNESGGSMVAWCWDAGSSTVTNTDGSITSQVRANASAGFSIVTYTGNGTAGTVGHGGLASLANGMIIVQTRTGTNNRSKPVYHASTGTNYATILDSTAAGFTSSGFWNNTAPTSTVFSVGTDQNTNQNGSTYVAYCFAPVEGYSAFGSYTGNGSTDGPFVYTGHRSRWLMIKRTNTTSQWSIWDTARNTYNAAGTNLWADTSEIEITSTVYQVDFLSNGFKMRTSHSERNASGGTYIYMSFAESPFQYARAR